MSEAQIPEKRSTAARLPLMVLWAIAPALSLVLAGLAMEFVGANSALAGLFMVIGLYIGPLALLAWSVCVLWWTSWNVWAKVIFALPLAAIMCGVNLFIAVGACAVIDPPFNMH